MWETQLVQCLTGSTFNAVTYARDSIIIIKNVKQILPPVDTVHKRQEHESKDCPNKVNTTLRCCANCKDNRFNGVKNSHTAFDSECPSYKAAKDRLKHRFTPQNSKNY